MAPILTTVEIGFRGSAEEAEFQQVYPRMEEELQAIPGMLEFRTYHQDPRVYLFFTVWEDQAALDRWVGNEFHRQTLMPNFRRWCDLGWFGFWDARQDRERSKKCPACGRWTRGLPGWDSRAPDRCRQCGGAL